LFHADEEGHDLVGKTQKYNDGKKAYNNIVFFFPEFFYRLISFFKIIKVLRCIINHFTPLFRIYPVLKITFAAHNNLQKYY